LFNRIRIKPALAALLGLALANTAWGNTTKTAPGPDVVLQGAPPRPEETGVQPGLSTEVITMSTLDDVHLDSIGVLPAALLGLPADFWGDSNTETLAKLLIRHEETAQPEVIASFHQILLAEFSPPVGQKKDGALLLARVDHLLAAGALDQAEALLEKAYSRSRELFRRWFDISLLTGRADRACQAMLHEPGLTPSLKARVFCLFRSGDWSAAALTLRSGYTLGKISDADEQLLAMFLDPDLFMGEPDPPMPETLTPLNFTLREALALPRNGQQLPLAYLHGDLRNYAGWRNRLVAAERLARSQAIPYSALLEAYNEARPSASGGIWDRVRAVQSLRAALAGDDADAVSGILPTAYQALGEVGLQIALSELIFPRIIGMQINEQASRLRFRLALLHKEHASLTMRLGTPDKQDMFLAALTRQEWADAKPTGDLEMAILDALQGKVTPSRLGDMVQIGRKGEAVLRAMHLLASERRFDPVAIETAISVLVQAGMTEQAHDVAIQVLILNRQD
jgi:hypothetical protein